MKFIFNDYLIEPHNDECWALRKRLHHDSARAIALRKGSQLSKLSKDWDEPISYAHDLKSIFDKLLEVVSNDPAIESLDELKASTDTILQAQNDLYAAMTKEAMA